MSDTLPWLSPLRGAEASRETDRHAIEDLHIPSLDLMERASEGLAALVAEVAPEGVVAVVCGGGNNGGDGYAAARLLRDAWRDVRVLAAVPPEKLGGDARVQVERLPGDPPRAFTPAAFFRRSPSRPRAAPLPPGSRRTSAPGRDR